MLTVRSPEARRAYTQFRERAEILRMRRMVASEEQWNAFKNWLRAEGRDVETLPPYEEFRDYAFRLAQESWPAM
jgi:hypothetical protein